MSVYKVKRFHISVHMVKPSNPFQTREMKE